MRKVIFVFLFLIILSSPVFAYKVYYYDSVGNRVYKTVEQKDFARYKQAPRRSYIRKPRTNWEITDSMRARKRTTSQSIHRNCTSCR